MDPFRDRVAVITGGASGIGAAMARAFAERGARLVLADIDEASLARTVKELEDRGAEVLGIPTDVTSRESVGRAADASFDRFGGVHILCNNAGVAFGGDILKATDEDWKFVMDIDFWGVVHGIQAFVPRMVEQGEGGHIVNTASMAGLIGMSWLGLYSAAKFAVVGLSESLARELKPRGIRVSVLCPMIVETNIGPNSVRLRTGSEAPPGTPSVAMAGGVISPDEVGKRVARGIERGDLYILTHPEQREILQRRAARLDALFADDVWPL